MLMDRGCFHVLATEPKPWRPWNSAEVSTCTHAHSFWRHCSPSLRADRATSSERWLSVSPKALQRFSHSGSTDRFTFPPMAYRAALPHIFPAVLILAFGHSHPNRYCSLGGLESQGCCLLSTSPNLQLLRVPSVHVANLSRCVP